MDNGALSVLSLMGLLSLRGRRLLIRNLFDSDSSRKASGKAYKTETGQTMKVSSRVNWKPEARCFNRERFCVCVCCVLTVPVYALTISYYSL